MTIETVCPQCGKSYRVRDEMAGKRFRCKACQAAVSIPTPASSKAAEEDDWDDDFLGGLDTAVKSERRAPTGGPPPIVGKSRHGSPTRRKSDSHQKPDGDKGFWHSFFFGPQSPFRVFGSVIASVIAVSISTAIAGTIWAIIMGDGGADPAWTAFTPKEGEWFEAILPGTPQLRPFAGAAPESKRYVGETSQVAAAVTEDPIPAEAVNRTPKQLLELLANQFAARHPVATIGDKRALSFGKHPALEFTLTVAAGEKHLTDTTRIVLTDNAIFTLEFVADGADDATDRDEFFNSFGLRDTMSGLMSDLLDDTTNPWSNETP